MVVMDGPFGHHLGILWLNGIVDFPLLGFLSSGLLHVAPKGSPLGNMAPSLVYMLKWPLLQQ